MSYIIVDVEADGPCPPAYSMVCFGAVILDPSLTKTFYGKTKPISPIWKEEALKISAFTRAEHETFDEPSIVMKNFADWLRQNSIGSPSFISDNPAFDWQWINYYFHTYLGKNPFGFSARRIGDIFAGMKMNITEHGSWKKLRQTKHDHNPVNDAIGNAQALLEMQKMGLVIPMSI